MNSLQRVIRNLSVVVVGLALVGAASGEAASSSDAGSSTDGSLPDSDYTDPYTLEDDQYGTSVTVTVDGSTRLLESNALPNHDTGDFPNDGNPNTITEQSNQYTFPAVGVYVGDASTVRETGVAVNGVKFSNPMAPTTATASPRCS